jgi:hypothetical protein
MNLIEINCPAEALDEDQRRSIAEAIISNLLVEPDAPPQALERAGRATHVWFHEARTWTTGAGHYRAGSPMPIVVTITVAEAWREELKPRAMAAVRAAMRSHAPGAALADEAVWINLVGIHDGSIGMNGRPTTSTDIVRHLTPGVQPRQVTDLPDGVVIDPVCGMRVHLGPQAITLEHDGRTVGCCATGCQQVYAQDHGLRIEAAARSMRRSGRPTLPTGPATAGCRLGRAAAVGQVVPTSLTHC